MGLVGWADAPNSIDQNTVEPSTDESQELTFDARDQPPTANSIQENNPEESSFDADPNNAMAPSCSLEGASESYEEDPCYFDQIVEMIRDFKIRRKAYDYDITYIERDELLFVLKHAERAEQLDYFKLIREVHAVLRRILEDDEIDERYIKSENLSAVLNYLIKRYDEVFEDCAEDRHE